MDYKSLPQIHHAEVQRRRSVVRKALIPFASLYLCVIYSGILFFSCARHEPSRAEFVLGTVCNITLFDQAKSSVYQDIFKRIREIENLMSVNIPASDVSRINAAAGTAPVQVHEDVFKVIERSLHFAQLSGGAFDPTVGPLVSLWGIDTENPRVPSREEIDNVLPLINWRDVELNAGENTVFLKRHGMALNLGAIAKGFAADETAAIIKNAGVKRAIIDLGGNIIVYGEKRDPSPWRVGIQNPNEERGAYMGVLQVSAIAAGKLTGKTVVTSGVNERFFEKDGIHYHHIFSPSQGYPVNNGLLSVTIIGANSMDADALSTTLFVLGYEKSKPLIEALPGTEAVFVFEDLSVRITPGADFTLTDKSFRLKS